MSWTPSQKVDALLAGAGLPCDGLSRIAECVFRADDWGEEALIEAHDRAEDLLRKDGALPRVQGVASLLSRLQQEIARGTVGTPTLRSNLADKLDQLFARLEEQRVTEMSALEVLRAIQDRVNRSEAVRLALNGILCRQRV